MKQVLLLLLLSISAGLQAQTLYFPPTTGNAWDTLVPEALGWCPHKIDSLYTFLEDNNTRAFLLLKDGRIVLERYFAGHTQTTPWQWASAGKTLTAFMIGIAQQEQHLSISDAVSDYLGQGWTSCPPAEESRITIRHQLTMTSGLDDDVQDNFCTLDTCLLCLAAPGTRWAYHNAPYTLLDGVIEGATGMTLNAYTNQKLKNPTGMTGLFVPVGYNNVYFSNARSMGRFGLLILNRGNWNGRQIMTDTAYFDQMVNTSQPLNESYGYLWWLNGKSSFRLPQSQFSFPGPLSPHAPGDMIAGLGKDGQFVNIAPGEGLVWVRMGEAPDGLAVPYLLNDQIWAYINELACQTSATEAAPQAVAVVNLSPNPTGDLLRISADQIITAVEVYTVLGRRLASLRTHVHNVELSVKEWPAGMVLVRVAFSDGSSYTGRVMVE